MTQYAADCPGWQGLAKAGTFQTGSTVLMSGSEIFGPMSVTTTLPHGTPEDVRAEVHRAMDLCRDKASLVFFTSNTINPDVPLENLQTYWRTVIESSW